MNTSTIHRSFTSIFSKVFVDLIGRDTGAFLKPREIFPLPFALAMLVACCSGATRSLAGARRAYERLNRTTVARSSFDEKVDAPTTVLFFWGLVQRALAEGNRSQRRALPKPFRFFLDIIVEDGTHLAVRSSLKDRLKSTNAGKAAMKLLASMSLLSGLPTDLRFAAAVHHDAKLLRTKPKKGCLYLRDLGFYDHHQFALIHQADAFFVSLLKGGVNLHVTKVFSGNIQPNTLLFREHVDDDVVDVDVRFSVEGECFNFRVISLVVPVEDRHGKPTNKTQRLWWVSNLGREHAPQVVAALYRLRYGAIERLFRSLKNLGRMDQLDSGRMTVVMVFVLASMLLQILSTIIVNELGKEIGKEEVSEEQVMRILTESWESLARTLVNGKGEGLWRVVIGQVERHGRTPNRKQPRVMKRVIKQMEEHDANQSLFPQAAT